MEYLFLAIALMVFAVLGGLIYQQVPIWTIRPQKPKLTLSDVVANDGPKEILLTNVKQLLDPSFPASALTSILLFGPHETGKKTIVRAAAGSAMEMGKVHFYDVNCASLVSNTEAEVAVANLIRVALSHAPSIVSFSNLELIVDDKELVLLIRSAAEHLHGSGKRVLLIGTASALCEKTAEQKLGFFSSYVEMDFPNRLEREVIVKHWLDKTGNKTGYNVTNMVNELQGCTYTQIISALDFAAHLARGNKSGAMTEIDFVKALYFRNRVLDSTMDASEILKCAYHEAGHALCHVLSGGLITRMSAYPATGRPGFTKAYLPDGAITKHTMFCFLTSTLGGIVAEEISYGEGLSAGGRKDLETARMMAQSYLADYGFGTTLSGYVDDGEVEDLLQSALETARSIVSEHRQRLEEMA
ncbi:MAG TPA: AAA family ATPase, partial [Methanocorpusculum sp.]|nr:AAA family ATPase [Methanocorpusculum sp.]